MRAITSDTTAAAAALYARNGREPCVLVLQGGGALGAYQAGVYERLAAAGLEPGWLAGISIGAINAALIAGNPPALRVQRLRDFWERVGLRGDTWAWLPVELGWSAGYAMAFGVPGFFLPRMTPAALAAPGSEAALSLYDTAPLKATLAELVDFDRINSGPIRLSVGAVEVCTGEPRWFDSAREPLGVEHVLASAALPPGFPPVIIDGIAYWDGGVVSNTPLQFVLEQPLDQEILVFAVDLFSAHGPMPRNLAEVAEREKDIRYSSRMRVDTELARRLHHGVTLVQLIHRRKQNDGPTKDFEFARDGLAAHWRMGHEDMNHTLRSAAWRDRAPPRGGVRVIDAAQRHKDPMR